LREVINVDEHPNTDSYSTTEPIVSWRPGQNIVINPPEDSGETFWLAKITSKNDDKLTIKWYDKISNSVDKYTSKSTVDEIPIASVFDDLTPILTFLGNDTYVLSNMQDLLDHIMHAYG